MKKSEVSNQKILLAVEGLSTAVADLSTAMGEFSNNVENNFKEVRNGIVALESGQEEIRLRLDNVAYKFEVRDLERRVSALEAK